MRFIASNDASNVCDHQGLLLQGRKCMGTVFGWVMLMVSELVKPTWRLLYSHNCPERCALKKDVEEQRLRWLQIEKVNGIMNTISIHNHNTTDARSILFFWLLLRFFGKPQVA
jgi:hypothetical protein